MLKNDLESVCNIFTKIIKLDPIRPITDLVEIYSQSGIAHIGSTDGSTRIVATVPCSFEFDNAVVSLSRLTKLIKLVTTEKVKLKHKGDYVELVGNGKYKLPIQLNEVGENISLVLSMPTIDNGNKISIDTFKRAIDRNSTTLYVGDAHLMFHRFYSEDNCIITTDCASMCVTKGSLCLTEMYPKMVNQLSNLPNDFIFTESEGGYRISCDNIEMFMLIEKAEGFPISIVKPLLNVDKSHKLVINKSDIMNLLKRAELFKSMSENTPSLMLCVENNVVTMSNKDNDFSEELSVVSCECEDIDFKVSLELLLKILRKLETTFNLYITNKFICLEDSIGYYLLAAVSRESD